MEPGEPRLPLAPRRQRPGGRRPLQGLEQGGVAALVDQFPKAERAKGFLEGVALASHLGISSDDVDVSSHTDEG